MLFLLFQMGNERYALDTRQVVEVVPLLEIKTLPQSPKGIAGIFTYRGKPVPAVDLCELAMGKRARERLSTRIIIMNLRAESGGEHLLGIIAESATEMLRKDPAEFVDSKLRIEAAPYLGPVFMDANGAIQWINERHLLSHEIQNLIFAETTYPKLNEHGTD
jgi:chemotaxis-related protein WspB